VTATPKVNLVSNIGFGSGATHTIDKDSPMANMPAVALELPLVHPPYLTLNARADAHAQRTVFGSLPAPEPPRARKKFWRFLRRR
jgi:hypothetical protein